MTKKILKDIEQQIDSSFASNQLLDLGFTHAVWTLLSAVEEHHFKNQVFQPTEDHQQTITTDILINSVTYPMQSCWKNAKVINSKFEHKLINENYSLALDWLEKAEDYMNFCSIFPLYHNGIINIKIVGNRLEPTDWSSFDLSYEAYDRLVGRREKDVIEATNPHEVVTGISKNIKIKDGSLTLNFNPRLVQVLTQHLQPELDLRFTLPTNWNFKYFSIQEFKTIFNTIQAMAFGWFQARALTYKNLEALGYNSSLWVPEKIDLLQRLTRYTNVEKPIISYVLDYLTYGSNGVRNPDIAIQPLVDLKNGQYAISPFLWLNVNCERNLCVLLNQIEEEKYIYSRLVNQKEKAIRQKIINDLSDFDYEFKNGKLDKTDLDLAIIDRKNKKCLAVELKWFIEPAEIREVIQRSEEIIKGVTQAKLIRDAFHDGNHKLIEEILGIDKDYEFMAIVGSANSIGNLGAQDDNIPVIKCWHLVSKIQKTKDLGEVMSWLSNRNYLLKKKTDYQVIKYQINSGDWEADWYGIKKA